LNFGGFCLRFDFKKGILIRALDWKDSLNGFSEMYLVNWASF
jgi:hypothetical protein